ncbi:MAG: ABC transporter substrate-binding protein [Cyclobacteriaceae bacterium]|nr:ABC transporter substrate-binding protein [Cyclobacteriaceae bacterium]
MLGETVRAPFPPKRIISLVPSQTELLASLELDDEVVGITKFCIHPDEWRQKKSKVGGTKNVDVARIQQLQPDLIIGSKEENEKLVIERLRVDFPVWMSNIISPQDALSMIDEVGKITNRAQRANDLIANIQHSWRLMAKLPTLRVLYLIWQEPWMGVGSETFIDGMLRLCGLENCLSGHSRYPELSDEDIRSLQPDLIFLSSEPYPFKEKHQLELETMLPGTKTMLVDGEYFSWYGSRMLLFADYVNSLRHQLG